MMMDVDDRPLVLHGAPTPKRSCGRF
jgi:hypothetical protein